MNKGDTQESEIASMKRIWFGEEMPTTRGRTSAKLNDASRTQVQAPLPRSTSIPPLKNSQIYEDDLTIVLPPPTSGKHLCVDCGKDDKECGCCNDENCECECHTEIADKVEADICNCKRRDQIPLVRIKVQPLTPKVCDIPKSDDIPSFHQFHGGLINDDDIKTPTSGDKVHTSLNSLDGLEQNILQVQEQVKKMDLTLNKTHDTVNDHLNKIAESDKLFI